MKKQNLLQNVPAMALCLVTASPLVAIPTAEAALLCRSLDNNSLTAEAYYDTNLNVTWLKDANLFKTQATANPNLVRQIIVSVGAVHDVPNFYDTPQNSGIHILTASDFDAASGNMTWFGAQAFTTWLNNQQFGGATGWRLPSALRPNGDVPCLRCTDSEFNFLYSNDLGGVSPSPISAQHSANYGLFTNITDDIYWTGTEDANSPFGAWVFNFRTGFQNEADQIEKIRQYLVWPARSGNTGTRCN